MRIARLTMIMIVLSLSFVISGCPSPTSTVSETTPPGRTVPPASGPLRLYGTDPYTLDPAQAADMNSHSYIVQLFNGLVRLDDDLNVVPDIAETWDISTDRRNYTFHLRDDVYFNDGRNVTAQDVKYSWERACKPGTMSPVAATYLGDIVGVRDMLAGNASSISGVTVKDDRTLEVTIGQPKSYFISKLTYPTSFVVDRETVEGSSSWWRTDPNGTGPFKLADWQYQSSITLERNTNYHGQIASLERVEFTLWSGIPVNLYEEGEIDAADIGVSYIDRARDPEGAFAGQLYESPEISFSWIGFNTTTEPFNDVHVRRAFTMALDKNKIISVMFRDLVANARGVLPPGIPGYNEDLQGLEFDAQQARQELAASKYGGRKACQISP
jgi:oligopeptide transport system substrate-binding protein